MSSRNPDFTSIVGTVVEAVRYTNVNRYGLPLQRAPERREVWLRTVPGNEAKYVIHSRVFPARMNHQVMLLLDGQTVLALFNLSTGDAVNYTREDPATLFHWSDLFTALTVSLGAYLLWGAVGWPVGLLVWVPFWTGWLVLRWRLQRRVDSVLHTLVPNDMDDLQRMIEEGR